MVLPDINMSNFNPYIDRDPKDFLTPEQTFAQRFGLTIKYSIKALPPWILVVDLSHWNEIDFAALRASGVVAIILKCSEGSEGSYWEFKDPDFETNWRKALDEGFPIMLYHFFRDAKGSAEKSWFMKCADSFLNDPRINGHTAVWLDVEWTKSGISTSARASRSFGFCDLIRGEGMRQGIYSSPGLVAQLFPPNDPRWDNVFQWNAHWTPALEYTLPSGWSHEMIMGWQFGIYDDHYWTPKVTGAGDVDVNKFFFENEAGLRTWMEQNGQTPPPPPTHIHADLQAQIDAIKVQMAELFVESTSQGVAIEELEEVTGKLSGDIIDRELEIDVIQKQLQDASDSLDQGGDL